MSTSQFQRIVDQVAPVTQHLHFHVKGEPLLHPRLGDLLDIAQAAGLRVHLVTNGTLLAGVSDLLLGHPAIHQVNVSLHSFEPGSGAPGMKEPESGEAYLSPILDFARRAEAGGRILTVLRFWTGTDASASSRFLPAIEAAFARDGHRLGARTFLNFAEPFEWPSLVGPERSERGFCLGLRDQIGVLVDGTVVPCCLDGEGAVALGNLFVDDLGTILAGSRARALYDGFSDRKCVEPLCRRCEFRERFDGNPIEKERKNPPT